MGTFKNTLRVGNFTSSEIHKLLSEGKVKGTFGKPALTYIEEKNFERELGRSLNAESGARPLLWGSLLEKRAFDLLPTSYTLNSDETMQHPDFDFWSGSPDGFNLAGDRAVFDIKCPYTLKSFCRLSKCNTADDLIENGGDDGEKYYWQLVSNAVITGCNSAELIIYMPYKSELLEIDHMVDCLPIDEVNSYRWIKYAGENDLPFLMTRGKYKNMHTIRFDIPEGHKKHLTEKVVAASKLLCERFIAE